MGCNGKIGDYSLHGEGTAKKSAPGSSRIDDLHMGLTRGTPCFRLGMRFDCDFRSQTYIDLFAVPRGFIQAQPLLL